MGEIVAINISWTSDNIMYGVSWNEWSTHTEQDIADGRRREREREREVQRGRQTEMRESVAV